MYTFTGCSGFHYDHWQERFYPSELKKNEWLPYYAKYFKTVEINNSFYRLPKKETLKKWHGQTPGDFRFTMKGSQYISHRKKLVDDENMRSALKNFYNTVEVLGSKLGCILWQLPGNLHRNDEKLDTFCSRLSTDFRNVMEFRHSSWFTEPVMEILSSHQVSFCIISAPDNLPEDNYVTTDTGYVRFHGKSQWYNYNYSENELQEWSSKIKKLAAERVYLYFNNDAQANAITNGQTMRKLLDE